MKFIKNTFPNQDFEPKREGYTKMKEPPMHALMMIALPVGAVTAAVLFVVAQRLTTVKLGLFNFPSLGLPLAVEIIIWLVAFVAFNAVMIPLHELLHALMFPEPLKSERVYFGFHNMGAFYAFYTEDLKRWQMLLSMATPFVVLTLTPWVLIVVYNVNLPLLMLAILYHAFTAAGDLIGIYLVLKNTPTNSVLKNKGYDTYYKR